MKKVSLMVAMALLVLGFAFTLVLVPQAHAQSYSRSTTTSLTKISKATQPNADRCGGGAWVEDAFVGAVCVSYFRYFSAVTEICSDYGYDATFDYTDANHHTPQVAVIYTTECQFFNFSAGDVSVANVGGGGCIIIPHRVAYVGPTSPNC